MTFTKKQMIQFLDTIKTTNNVDINTYIDDVLNNDIPMNALRFINLYIPLKELGVFNLIYSKRRKTPLFKNFTKRNINDYEKTICLGSLLTQMLCYVKVTNDNIVDQSQIIGAISILNALQNFLSTGSFELTNTVYDNFSEIFKFLYAKEDE